MKDHMGVEAEEEASSFLHAPQPGIKRTGLSCIFLMMILIRSFLNSKSSDCEMNCDEGTAWKAVAHIITGVIGSGVLSLAWSMAQLGWIAGPVTMLCFASVTLLSAFLLCDCYRSPDPEFGPKRNRSYLEAVHETLGRYKNILLVLMSSSFFLILIIFSNHSYN
jgi:hypothetical protein